MLNGLCSANFPNDFGVFPMHTPALSQDTLLANFSTAGSDKTCSKMHQKNKGH